jgi:hypothetical protein
MIEPIPDRIIRLAISIINMSTKEISKYRYEGCDVNYADQEIILMEIERRDYETKRINMHG